MKGQDNTKTYKGISIFILLIGFFYMNVVFDFSSVFSDLGNNSALTTEFQKSLIRNHIETREAEEALNSPIKIAPTKRAYIEKVSEGIISIFTYFFSFIHEESEKFALGKWRDDLYVANAYGAFDTMSLNVFSSIDEMLDNK